MSLYEKCGLDVVAFLALAAYSIMKSYKFLKSLRKSNLKVKKA